MARIKGPVAFAVATALLLFATSPLAGTVPSAAAQTPPEANLSGVTQISVGHHHACALLTSGQARCWGWNINGQLGDGTLTDRLRPVIVTNSAGEPLADIVQITAGAGHTCARLSNRQARCWGDNTDGQLGDGTRTRRTRAVPVLPPTGSGALSDVAQIEAGGGHTCARLTNGQSRCWGWNAHGELGDGTATLRTRPVTVLNTSGPGPLTAVTQIDAGIDTSCARLGSGEARCWGWDTHGHNDGQSGQPRPFPVRGPNDVGRLTAITQISLGSGHTCTRQSGGQARCWGINSGNLGDGTITDREFPVTVKRPSGSGPLGDVAQIVAASQHTCARLSTGQARCWGFAPSGALGHGATTYTRLPVSVLNTPGTGNLGRVRQIDTANSFTCALLTTQQVRCWGDNRLGELGDGTRTGRSLPVAVVT